ncbi:hypothetical protein GCM10027269_77620 [Kribbella endophytica]
MVSASSWTVPTYAEVAVSAAGAAGAGAAVDVVAAKAGTAKAAAATAVSAEMKRRDIGASLPSRGGKRSADY